MGGTGQHLHYPLQLLHLVTQAGQSTPGHCTPPQQHVSLCTHASCQEREGHSLTDWRTLYAVAAAPALARLLYRCWAAALARVTLILNTLVQNWKCVCTQQRSKPIWSQDMMCLHETQLEQIKGRSRHPHTPGSDGMQTVQFSPCMSCLEIAFTPSFSSCKAVPRLPGRTGAKPVSPLEPTPTPAAPPLGEAGAGAAPSSPAVERPLAGAACRASIELSRLLKAACNTSTWLNTY